MLPAKKRKFIQSEFDHFDGGSNNNDPPRPEVTITVSSQPVVEPGLPGPRSSFHDDGIQVTELSTASEVVDLSTSKPTARNDGRHSSTSSSTRIFSSSSSPSPRSRLEFEGNSNSRRPSFSAKTERSPILSAAATSSYSDNFYGQKSAGDVKKFDIDLREWVGSRVLARRDKYFCPGLIRNVYEGYSVSILFDGEDQPLIYREVLSKEEYDTIICDAIPKTKQVTASI